jgi:NAD(P)-dependent dehydrogenase (short-subunit alcohol dehydrogenase family)
MVAILVTGAGSGIGKAVAQGAAARGDQVLATVFAEGEEQSLAAIPSIQTLRMDVSSTESVVAGFAEADRLLAGTPLHAVVNCAGYCPLGAAELQPIELVERTLNINFVGSVRVLQQALPRLRGHGGRLILLSSLWGKVGGPMLSAYCASKHAIEALADSARRETRGQDVHVVLVEPGAVRTPLMDRQVADAQAACEALPEAQRHFYGELYRSYHALLEKSASGGISAAQCAAVVDRALSAHRPRTRYRAGSDAKAITLLAGLLSDTTMDRLFKAMLK